MKCITPRIVQATDQSSGCSPSASRLCVTLTHVDATGARYHGYATDNPTRLLSITAISTPAGEGHIARDLDASAWPPSTWLTKRLPTIAELEALGSDRGPAAVLLRSIIEIVWSESESRWGRETIQEIAQVLATAGLSPEDWPPREKPTAWLLRTLRETVNPERLRSMAIAMASRLDDETVRALFAANIERGVERAPSTQA